MLLGGCPCCKPIVGVQGDPGVIYANDDAAIQRSLPILILRSKGKDDYADDLVEFCAPAGCLGINVSRIRRKLIGRGESGWRSDWTSTPGAWRHAGARFLLSGDWVNNTGGIRARNLQLSRAGSTKD